MRSPRSPSSGLVAPLLLVLAGATLPARAQTAPPPDRPAAPADYERGVALAGQRRYREAAAAFAASYARDRGLEALFAWAQAERLAGDCGEALPLYEEFLRYPLTPTQTQAGELGRRRCREALAAVPPAPPEAPPRERPSPGPPPSAPPPTRTDWIAGGLLGAGTLGVGAGLAFLALSVGQDQAAGRADDFDEYLEHRDRARLDRAIGLGVAGLGAALLAGGVLRLWLDRRAGRGETTALSAPLCGGGALLLRGRF